MNKRWHLAWALPCAGVLGFMGWKAHAVARELVDPPFYRPQPLTRVNETYAELARGGDGDPGGIWSCARVGERELWYLKRPTEAKGVVLLLHGFGDDRWGTSPALKWFPTLDAAIFTYLDRDEAMRKGSREPYITFGVRESNDVVAMVHHLESRGMPRNRILLMGRSLGATVGLLALGKLESEPAGALGGFVWEGAPLGSRDFAERLVRGPVDRAWHVLAPSIGNAAARWAAALGRYEMRETDPRCALSGRKLRTPSLCFLATQDRLAPPAGQRELASRFLSLRSVEVNTWHLHCADILGPKYAQEIRQATQAWLP